MNFTQLVDLVQAEARTLGVEEPSERQIRDWIEESLLLPSERASGHGGKRPVWKMPIENLERCRRILAFRQHGTKRSSGLMIQLWLDGFDCPLLMVREALSDEIDRIACRLFSDGHPAWMQRRGPMTPEQTAKRSNRLGPLDSRLEAFRASDRAYVQMVAAACVGDEGEFDEDEIIVEELERLMPELTPLIAEIVNRPLLAGLLFKPLDKETPSPNRELIEKTTDADLIAARAAYQTLKLFFHDPSVLTDALAHNLSKNQAEAFAAAANALNSADWEVLVFVIVLRFLKAATDASFDDIDPAIVERLLRSGSVRRMVESLPTLEASDKIPTNTKTPPA